MIKLFNSLISFFALLALFTACKSKEVNTEEELINYIKQESNMLVKNEKTNGLEINVSYKPVDLIVMQQLKSNKNLNVDSLKKHFDKYYYFTIDFSENGKELNQQLMMDKVAYGQAINDLAFKMSSKVYLTDNKNDTLPIADYVYSRLFGATGKSTFLFSFSKPQYQPETLHLYVITDDIGSKKKFTFNGAAINNIPHLILN